MEKNKTGPVYVSEFALSWLLHLFKKLTLLQIAKTHSQYSKLPSSQLSKTWLSISPEWNSSVSDKFLPLNSTQLSSPEYQSLMSPWSLSKIICWTGPFYCIPNQINPPCWSSKTCDWSHAQTPPPCPGGSSSASSKNSSLPVYSVSSSFSSSAATTKAFPTFLSAPTLIQVSHVLMKLKFIAISREVDCPTSCLSFKLKIWVALELIKSHKISKNSFLLEIYRTVMMVMMILMIIIMMTMMMNPRWKLARWRC